MLLKKNSMSVIQVRPATLRDAKAIAEIHVASSQDAYKALLPAAALDAMSVQRPPWFGPSPVVSKSMTAIVSIKTPGAGT